MEQLQHHIFKARGGLNGGNLHGSGQRPRLAKFMMVILSLDLVQATRINLESIQETLSMRASQLNMFSASQDISNPIETLLYCHLM